FIIGSIAFIGRSQIIDLWDSWMTDPLPEPIAYDQISIVNNTNVEISNTNTVANINSVTEPIALEVEPQPLVLPDEINLEVPFTSQAPHANWDLPYQEACEEASAITVHYFYQNLSFTPDVADREILDLVAWQEDNLGFYKDTTAEQTAQFMRDYWGYKKIDVIYDPTINDIKSNLAAGRPVILPAAGQELGNPYFTPPGPIYHMLVVRGYTETQFITNDVGTKRGENFRYDYDVLMKAMHDWNDGDVANGQKVIIVVYPNP
ncbi:C39 family peptidase, partial [Patescibacteria group bacterium]|nr:C39 family peptidase [Patescibacteria group bacterium]